MAMQQIKNDDYWFFLSYSSDDNDDNLKRFWLELALELRKAAPIDSSVEPARIGFRDKKEIYIGADWSNYLSKALQTSRVLLCLYSRSYFASDYCGRELQLFLDRVKRYSSTLNGAAAQPRLIIPILWDLPRRYLNALPQAIKHLQYYDEDLGELYAAKGLSYLMKVETQENQIAYRQFVIAIADKIAQQGQTHQMDAIAPVPLIDNATSAFHVQPTPQVVAPLRQATHLPATVTVPIAKGPEAAWFDYVAGREQDYDKIRTHRQCYGTQGGFDWKPYFPVQSSRQ